MSVHGPPATSSAAVTAHVVFVVAMLVAVLLAALQSFGSNVLSRRLPRLVVLIALVGAVYLGTSRDFYMPFLGPTIVPTSVLKLGAPADATVAITVEAPAGATHAMYWAAASSAMPTQSAAKAYSGFNNAGIVEVAAGRATMRVACPGTYTVGWGKLVPRHVHYRFIYANGMTSSVKTAPITCP